MFFFKPEIYEFESVTLDVQIINLQPTGSTTVANIASVYFNKEGSENINYGIDINGGKFPFFINSQDSPYIYCELYLSIQSIGDFKLIFETSPAMMSFSMGNYNLVNNDQTSFECRGVFWTVKTIKIRNKFSVIITLRDSPFAICALLRMIQTPILYS